MFMNMRDYPTLHLGTDSSKITVFFIAALHLTVTVGSTHK